MFHHQIVYVERQAHLSRSNFIIYSCNPNGLLGRAIAFKLIIINDVVQIRIPPLQINKFF